MRTKYVDPNGLKCVLHLLRPVGAPNWVITKIYTEPEDRNQGAATRLLEQICADADRKNVVVKLTAIPLDRRSSAMNVKQLSDWYARHGFEPTGVYQVMQREPR